MTKTLPPSELAEPKPRRESKFAWLDAEVDPIVAEARRVAREILLVTSDVRETSDALASKFDVPTDTVIQTQRDLREVALALEGLSRAVDEGLRKKVEALREEMDLRFEEIIEQLRKLDVDERVDDALAARDRLADVVRERMTRRLHLATMKEAEGGEELYVKVSRLFAAELEEILAEAGVTAGSTR